jgi:hypothetical protein
MLDAVVPMTRGIGAFGRFIGRLFLAICPLANRTVVFETAILARFDANTVEKGGIDFHGR